MYFSDDGLLYAGFSPKTSHHRQVQKMYHDTSIIIPVHVRVEHKALIIQGYDFNSQEFTQNHDVIL